MRCCESAILPLALGFAALTGGSPITVRAQAQADTTRTAVRLRVLGDSNVPVPEAEVTLKRERAAVSSRTDSLGESRFELPSAGVWRATIRRIGFGPANVDLHLGNGENALIVHLDRTTATLDEVRVIANRRTLARHDDFEMRRLRQDANSTISRAEIEHRNPIKLSQLLRTVSGVRIADSSGNIVAISLRGNKSSRAPIGVGLVPCVMRLTIDGVVMPALSNIDQVLPVDVYGIEVFNGPARLPPQLSGVRSDNWCGVIAIWTRD